MYPSSRKTIGDREDTTTIIGQRSMIHPQTPRHKAVNSSLGCWGSNANSTTDSRFGQKCEEYIENLGKAINDNRSQVAAYLETAPTGIVASAGKETDASFVGVTA